MDCPTGDLDMDGTRRDTGPTREVKRHFVGVRLDAQIMTAAYERVLPWMRGRNGAEPAHHACGEVTVGHEDSAALPRRVTGA
jgi:hypothetical protein